MARGERLARTGEVLGSEIFGNGARRMSKIHDGVRANKEALFL
jgi:hypothetical protein